MFSTFLEIKSLLNFAVEAMEVEFKAGPSLDKLLSKDSGESSKAKSELVKDVTAMAHAAGGTIIYGVKAKEVNGQSVADSIVPVIDPGITRDRLTDLITANTEPRFSGFRIQVIPTDEESAQVFVIEVDKADTAHQSKIDFRYYRRIEASARAMHDFEIREVMNRKSAALVEVKIFVRPHDITSATHRYLILPHLTNIGSLTAHHWTLELDLPDGKNEKNNDPHGLVLACGEVVEGTFRRTRFEYSSERHPPAASLRLLPGQSMTLAPGLGFPILFSDVDAGVNDRLQSLKTGIRWALYVDNTAKRFASLPSEDWCRY